MKNNIETILQDAANGDIIELMLKKNVFLNAGSGDFGLEISERRTETSRGPVKSVCGYFGGWERKEYRSFDGIYIDAFISPQQEDQWHESRLGAGHLIQIPFSAIESYEIIMKTGLLHTQTI